jgi:long-chain-fatty-acyl-CoA reductase
MADKVKLDLILHGGCLPAGDRRIVELSYEQGLTVRVPELTSADVARFYSEGRAIKSALADLTIREVAQFFAEIGRRWMSADTPWRRFADEFAPRITGYHPAMLANDYFLLGEFIAAPSSIYDQVQADLGHEHIFDEWIPVQASHVRAFGLGFAVHILVGNLPLAGLYSLIRASVARNVSLAKLPTRDPISAYAFVRTMIDLDPAHPLTRAMSLAYWQRDAEVGRAALEDADVALVWGGADAVRSVSEMAGGTPIVAFGPKRSLSVIDLDSVDHDKAALRLAYEMSYYDQEACFSTQQAYVKGDIAAFLPALERALARFGAAMPLVTGNRDVLAHRSASMLEARFRGWTVREAGDAFAVILPPTAELAEHPLTRTIYLRPIEDCGAVTPDIGPATQTLCVYPWSLAQSYRDEWGRAGVERIVELGMSRHPRQGFTHDGMRWLNQIVRMVSVERPTAQLYRYNVVDPQGLEDFLFVRPLMTSPAT